MATKTANVTARIQLNIKERTELHKFPKPFSKILSFELLQILQRLPLVLIHLLQIFRLRA
ncbi:MAG: hypothetical protein UHU19_03545 [Lachnospiraceae bacterium]|nr:hypothetical protein [Lachnospiraceae bacterium]